MAEDYNLSGGVIVPDNNSGRGIIHLLTHRMRRHVELVYYPHAYDIDLDRTHDFILLLSLDDLQRVIRFYDQKRRNLPLVIHVDTPDALIDIDHARLFPGVDVLPVAQAPLGATPDTTLELNLLAKIIARLNGEA
jgi:hypothetical protein